MLEQRRGIQLVFLTVFKSTDDHTLFDYFTFSSAYPKQLLEISVWSAPHMEINNPDASGEHLTWRHFV